MHPTLQRDIFQWDVRSWSRALPAWEGALDAGKPLNALAIGERGGGLGLLLAMHGAQVLCTDLGPMPTAAVALHQRYNVQERITYGTEDATSLSAADATYDTVIFKSVIGALGDKSRQMKAISEMHRVLKPGGMLLFAENLSGTRLHTMLRHRFTRWQGYWRYLHWPADRDLFEAFADVRTGTTGFLANLGRTENQRDLLARLDAVLCNLVPSPWHCILYGVCTKAR